MTDPLLQALYDARAQLRNRRIEADEKREVYKTAVAAEQQAFIAYQSALEAIEKEAALNADDLPTGVSSQGAER